MRCLSVCQPFADLIVSGRKTVELRGWNTRFRGPFLVHAPLRIRTGDCRRLKLDCGFVTGAVIGTAEIYGVKTYKSPADVRGDSGLHLASGNHLEKRYGFLLRNAKRLRIPIPCKGRLGFFEAGLPKNSTGKKEIEADIIDEEHRYRWVGCH